MFTSFNVFDLVGTPSPSFGRSGKPALIGGLFMSYGLSLSEYLHLPNCYCVSISFFFVEILFGLF